jgi:hypothetical protein
MIIVEVELVETIEVEVEVEVKVVFLDKVRALIEFWRLPRPDIVFFLSIYYNETV